MAAIARTAGAAATAMEALMHAADITATSSQEEATIDRPLTTREDTTRYLTRPLIKKQTKFIMTLIY